MSDAADPIEADDERPALFWLGATRPADVGEASLLAREWVAEALDAGRWSDALRVLRANRELVNAPRLDNRVRIAPLHHAGYHGAPEDVVRELLELGAWRTLTTADGERAVDLARRTDRGAVIVGLLTPVLRAEMPVPALAQLTVQLHALILERAAAEVEACSLHLPALSPLMEVPLGQRFWCPVPGMVGAFEYWLTHAGADPRLVVHTRCRIARAGNRRHEVTRTGYELLDGRG